MLYHENTKKMLETELFKNPSCEYRGAPFWAWNCKLNKRLLETQIEYFKEMGLGGFHMHSRTGLATKYLGEEFMELVKVCVDKAEKENMLAWLYDEDRWPSGAAGGLVTKDAVYRERKLVITSDELCDCVPKETAVKTGEPFLIACYDIVLNGRGELETYSRIEPEKKTAGDKWYAYVTTNEPSPWYNNQTYVDTLNKEAIDKFIEITYEAYKKAVGDKFGSVVPAIFTDEPQFAKKTTLDFAEDKKDVILPWTNDFDATYKAQYGIDLIDFLPELIWELPTGRISRARYLYHDHVAERFASAFADNCGKWCEENNIMLTGHMMAESTLFSQTGVLGETMRSYRSFQLPGIDMLCDRVEFTTAKQAQSACHQYGREGVLSELYGVTNWDFDFRGHKYQGDWQAALGVTVRVHHLSWVSMAGEAKRDYPASISYQSPWYKEYSYVENHFARLNTVLTRGKPVVKVGVIHPIESYWLHWGPKENTASVRERLDENFQNLTRWLLCGQVDFDFISESLLPGQCPSPSNPLKVGEMEYTVIIVPECETLRQSTLDRLKQFKKDGGRLIFLGNCPKYVDALSSDEVNNLYQISETTSFDRTSILAALENEKLIDIRNADGTVADNLLYTMRLDNDCRWLFIAHAVKTHYADAVAPRKIKLKITGEYTPTLYNTINGELSGIDYRLENGNTVIETELHCHDSLLLRLGEKTVTAWQKDGKPQRRKIAGIDFKQKVHYTREEPNVVLLDTAEYSFDGGQWQNTEEILRIDNKFREMLGFPLRQLYVAQPWTLEKEEIKHYVTLRFTMESEITVGNPLLAIEDADRLEIDFNGIRVPAEITGYYVDEAIQTLKLPEIKPGKNVLTVKMPFGRTTNVECCYILGNFNVRLDGCEKTITAAADTIGFGSITYQGMPFYGGNITYITEIETTGHAIAIKTNYYRGALIKVAVDGKPAGVIAYAPYTLLIENMEPGNHKIEFTLFGNRRNTFGALHNMDTACLWYRPNDWRTTGDAWGYEYRLTDTGILASPVIEVLE